MDTGTRRLDPVRRFAGQSNLARLVDERDRLEPRAAPADGWAGRRASIVAGVFVFVFGSLGYPLLPMIVGALTDHLPFSNKQVGAIASAEMVGMFLSAACALIWIRRMDWRLATAGFAVLLMLCDGVAAQLSAFPALMAVRGLAGFSGGSLMAIGATVVGDSDNPERNVALLNVAQTLVCALGFIIMPPLIDGFGTRGAFTCLAAFTLPALPLALLMPLTPQGRPRETREAQDRRQSAGDLAMLLFAAFPAFLFFAGYAASWTYVERIGVSAGFGHQVVGWTLSISLVAGAAGSAAAWGLGLRLGRVLPSLATLVFQLLALGVIVFFLRGPTIYLASMVVYVFFINFSGPYQVGLALHSDQTGRAAVLYLLMLKAGVSFAPFLASNFVHGTDYKAPLLLAGVLYGLCFLNIWCAATLLGRRDRALGRGRPLARSP